MMHLRTKFGADICILLNLRWPPSSIGFVEEVTNETKARSERRVLLLSPHWSRSDALCDLTARIKETKKEQVHQQDANPANVGGGSCNYVQHPRPPLRATCMATHQWTVGQNNISIMVQILLQ